MAEFYVRHSLNDKKAVKFNITLRYIIPTDEYGDHKWVLEIGTTHLDKNGNKILPKKIYLNNLNNLDEIIEHNVADLCSLIDWEPLVSDKHPPYVSYNYPMDNATNVSIFSTVKIVIEELLPAAGIDLSNMSVILNNGMTDIDITNDVYIEGDPYRYELTWAPSKVIRDTYF